MFVSCSKSPPIKPQNQLRICFKSFPKTTDPRTCGDYISSTLICLLFDGLTKQLPNGSTELALCDSYEISTDQKTYTFHLRKCFWTDQTLITAYDFERCWKQVLTPSFPSLCPYLLYPIQNAEKARQGLVPLDEVGIKATDEQTLIVQLERPTPYFLSLTSFPTYIPVPKDFEATSHQIDPTKPTHGSGPFQIESIRANSEIVLQKNKNYWNQDKIHLDKINISIISNETTARQMFERGELDFLGGAISPTIPDSFRFVSYQHRLRFDPMAATTFCVFQTHHPFLQNKNLRKALSLAINRDEIIEQITQMNEIPATRCLPPSLMGFRNKTLYQTFDPELAELYLKKALSELNIDISQLNKMQFSFSYSQINRQLAQTIQRQWKDTLNLDIELLQIEATCYQARLLRRDYDIALHFWIAQYNDPINILERFLDPLNAKNVPGWSCQRFIDLVKEAQSQTDPLDRFHRIEEAEQVLIEEMPLAPIYHWTNPSLTQPWVQNLESTPNGGILFERCQIDRM